MNIGFIGSGKVGFSLGKYFSINNLNVTGYYSKTLTSAIEAASFTDSKFYTSIETLISNCDIIFITTNDSSISYIVDDIVDFDIRDKIICHCSGSYSSEILNHIKRFGAFPYSIHPIYAFSNKYESYKKLNRATFSIEGDELYLNYLKNMLQKLGNEVIVLSKDQKTSYHLSCAIASNLVTSLLHVSKDIFCNLGFSEDIWVKALMPLIENNVNNIKNSGIENSLTGAISRKDFSTVENHIQSIPKEYKPIYIELSNHLARVCENYNNEDFEKLHSILGGYFYEKKHRNF